MNMISRFAQMAALPTGLCMLVTILCSPARAMTISVLQNSSAQQEHPQSGSGQQQGNSGNASSNATNGNKNGSTGANQDTGNKPAPLFSGSLTIQKSRQSTDSAALGFNGVGPDGQVQQAFLSATPSAASEQKAQAMGAYRPTPAELVKFEQDGGLTLNSTTQTK